MSDPTTNRPAPLLYLITDRHKLRSSPDNDPVQTLAAFIEHALRSGIDMVQIRERDLPARSIYNLASSAVEIASAAPGNQPHFGNPSPGRRGDPQRLRRESPGSRVERPSGEYVSAVESHQEANETSGDNPLNGSCAANLGTLHGRVLINDRADLAAASGAGVHLTTRSIEASVIRRTFGPRLLIGASTHSIDEAMRAEEQGADFIVFGPVFETDSKKAYGPPVGLAPLTEVCRRLNTPVLALGGITLSNYGRALDAGAAGIAGISIFTGSPELSATVSALKSSRSFERRFWGE